MQAGTNGVQETMQVGPAGPAAQSMSKLLNIWYYPIQRFDKVHNIQIFGVYKTSILFKTHLFRLI